MHRNSALGPRVEHTKSAEIKVEEAIHGNMELLDEQVHKLAAREIGESFRRNYDLSKLVVGGKLMRGTIGILLQMWSS